MPPKKLPQKSQKESKKSTVVKVDPEKQKGTRNAISHNMTRKQLALFGCPRTSKGTRREITLLADTIIRNLMVATLAVTEQQKRVVIQKKDVEIAYANLKDQYNDDLFLQ